MLRDVPADAGTELLIQQALGWQMVGRTMLIIAHRLSTIRNTDKIVVLEGKRIVETGKHEGGPYRYLVEVQLNIKLRLAV